MPFSSRGRSLFKMGGWSRSGPLGLRLDCSGEEMAEISRGWLMLFTCWEHADYTQMTHKSKNTTLFVSGKPGGEQSVSLVNLTENRLILFHIVV